MQSFAVITVATCYCERDILSAPTVATMLVTGEVQQPLIAPE